MGGVGRGIHCEAANIVDVALWLQNWTDRPDGVASSGGDAGIDDPDRRTLAQTLGHLGLRMISQRAVVDVFTVNHIENPSSN